MNKGCSVHVLIILDEICEMVDWLEENIDKIDFDLIMSQENHEGLRPLEFASQQGNTFNIAYK